MSVILHKREVWLDILKGIGIFSVVFGHVTQGVARDFIYLFHMPLFFLISGYLYKSYPTKQFFLKKFLQLIVPYFSFLLVLIVPFIIKYLWKGDYIGLSNIAINSIFGGVWLTGWFSVFWFVTCLFFVQQVYNILVQYFTWPYVVLVIIASYVLGLLNMFFYPNFFLPLGINTLFMALPLFFIGHLFKQKKASVLIKDFKIFCVMFILICASLILYGVYTVDYKFAIYGPLFIGFTVSVAFTFLLAIISAFLAKYHYIKLLLSYLGLASFTVMFLHQPIQIVLRTSFHITNVPLVVIVTILLCLFFHYLASSFRLTRVLFLGGSK